MTKLDLCRKCRKYNSLECPDCGEDHLTLIEECNDFKEKSKK